MGVEPAWWHVRLWEKWPSCWDTPKEPPLPPAVALPAPSPHTALLAMLVSPLLASAARPWAQSLLCPCSLLPAGSEPHPHSQDCGRLGATERGPGTCTGSASQSPVPQSHLGLDRVARTLGSSPHVRKSGVGAAVPQTPDTRGADHPCPRDAANELPTDTSKSRRFRLFYVTRTQGKLSEVHPGEGARGPTANAHYPRKLSRKSSAETKPWVFAGVTVGRTLAAKVCCSYARKPTEW